MEHLWTALFCTIHLGIGFFVGRSLRGPSTESPHGLAPAVARFENAYRELQPALVQLPSDFQQALESLKQSVQSLAEKVQTQPDQPVEIALAPRAPAPTQSVETRREPRHGHAVPEFMALWDGEISSIQAFERVQCHDVSVSGISFFFDRPLDVGEQLVITLGQQKGGVLMAAQVVYSRAIIVRGEDLYRVGCKFERRLTAGEAAMLAPLLATVRTVYSISR